LNIQISQGSAATNSRASGKFCSRFFDSTSLNAMVKKLLKPVHVYQSYPKSKSGTIFLRHTVYMHRLFPLHYNYLQFHVLRDMMRRSRWFTK